MFENLPPAGPWEPAGWRVQHHSVPHRTESDEGRDGMCSWKCRFRAGRAYFTARGPYCGGYCNTVVPPHCCRSTVTVWPHPCGNMAVVPLLGGHGSKHVQPQHAAACRGIQFFEFMCLSACSCSACTGDILPAPCLPSLFLFVLS